MNARLTTWLRVPHWALLALAACGAGEGESTFPIQPLQEFERERMVVEEVALAAQRQLAEHLLEGLVRHDDTLALDALAEGFVARFPAPEEGERIPDRGLSITTWQRAERAPLDAVGFLARLLAHVHDWTVFTRAELEPDRFWLAGDGTTAVARAELCLAGERGPGRRASLRATLDLALATDASGRWRLERLDLAEGERLEYDGAGFRDVTDQTGLAYGDSAENAGLAQVFVDMHRTLALGGLSALDWDGDGFWDLAATRRGQVATLFRNDGAGGFVPEPLPTLAPRECGSFLFHADLDGDGRAELVGSEILEFDGDRARLGLWVQRGERWERLVDALEFANPVGRRRLSIQAIVPCDVNNDQRLDLFFAVYGDAESRGADYNTVEAHDGADNLLFVNQGGLVFSEQSDERGIHGTQYTYVAQAFDFDADGDTDLFEGNDFGPNVLWRNDGEGNFVADDELGFGGVSAYTMGVTLADHDNSGRWSLYLSNMSSEAGGRLVPLADGIGEDMRGRVATIASGNQLYTQGRAGEPWPEHAAEARCNEAEWAWGCVFFDPDNDGDKDLFVTNGFTSHSNPALGDWQSFYWNQVLADAGFLERGEKSVDVNAGLAFEGSFNGYERDRLYYLADTARERFFEAAGVFDLDLDHDGRCVVPVDVDGDGDLDLALWTLGGLKLLENRAARGHFARLRLVATSTHPTALGAVARVSAGGVTQRDFVKLTDGFQSQVPADLHFGLGESDTLERVLVEWPSGRVQEWAELPADRLIVLTEGEHSSDVRELPAWPEDTRPREAVPVADTILDRAGGGSESLAAPDRPTVARFVASNQADPEAWSTVPDTVLHAWPELATLRAAHPEARCALLVPDATPQATLEALAAELPAGVPIFLADAELRARALGSDAAPHAPATLVFDAAGRLARAFYRPVDALEVSRVLSVLADEPPYPDLLVEAGRLALRRGQFRAAQGLFERATEVDARVPWAWEGLARAHVLLGRLDLAEQAYARSVTADPDYALGHYNLGVTRTNLGRPADALAPLREALRIRGDDLATLRALAEAALLADELEVAADAYGRAVPLDKLNYELVLNRAKVLGKLRRLEDARKAFQHAVNLRPRAREALDGLALVERLLAEERAQREQDDS